MKYDLGIIGVGNMGGALAAAAAKSGCKLAVSDKMADKAEKLAQNLGCSAVSNAEIAANCKYILLGVKPQFLSDTIAEISDILKSRADRFVVASMAAGVNTKTLANMLGFSCPIIRIMPNMPVSVGKGTVLCSQNELVEADEVDEFCGILAHAGIVDKISEQLIDAGCAVSGSGPAYVYMFIEALADGAVECGLPRDKALKYAASTVLGAAKAVLETGKHPGLLKDEVCSPGGTTIAGVHALENGAFRASAADAVTAGYKKAVELSKNK